MPASRHRFSSPLRGIATHSVRAGLAHTQGVLIAPTRDRNAECHQSVISASRSHCPYEGSQLDAAEFGVFRVLVLIAPTRDRTPLPRRADCLVGRVAGLAVWVLAALVRRAEVSGVGPVPVQESVGLGVRGGAGAWTEERRERSDQSDEGKHRVKSPLAARRRRAINTAPSPRREASPSNTAPAIHACQDRFAPEARKLALPFAVLTVTRLPEQVTDGVSVPGTTTVSRAGAAGETTAAAGTRCM
ncbi:hypothetical protein SAMN05421505_11331 [Sinosporangium album]|uniref:Uncharacterized protein n=1 Tax=Sinosporangium album TaxID=504805 RepID=A0A1G8AX60_9ACTN|nr:hypothetical protein SAMN05421505_11331 [Sinosporangium album]